MSARRALGHGMDLAAFRAARLARVLGAAHGQAGLGMAAAAAAAAATVRRVFTAQRDAGLRLRAPAFAAGGTRALHERSPAVRPARGAHA